MAEKQEVVRFLKGRGADRGAKFKSHHDIGIIAPPAGQQLLLF